MISAESVRKIFSDSNIMNVAVIDDVFDPPGSSFSAVEQEELFQQFTADSAIRSGFARAEKVLNEPADVGAETCAWLGRSANEGNDAAVLAWSIVTTMADSRRTSLDLLVSRLTDDLGLAVTPVPAKEAAKTTANIVPDDSDVIFLDYELDRGEKQGDLSSDLVRKIYAQFKGRKRVPLLILMSSLKLSETDLADFQSGTELLSGMFYFVPKEDLFNVERLHYRLAAFGRSLPTGQTMQKFVNDLEDALEAAKSSVFREVRSLSISDYAFLQTMRLHDDGQPMGEYLMWMISAHLVRELGASTGVRAMEDEVNGLAFEHLPPTQAKPTASLGTLYSSAVMRAMPDIPTGKQSHATYLHFGDVFRKEISKTVYVCITPACDLAFGPTRPIPSDRSILFLPGTLLPIDKPLKPFQQRQPRTELVRLDGSSYRIVWDIKEVARTRWADVGKWKTDLKLKRVARLNTAFALEVQRSFAADLTRIGMPVAPPLYNPVKVRVSCLDENGGEIELTSQQTDDAYVSGSERGERLVLGTAFMDALPEMLAKAEAAATRRVDHLHELRSKQGPGPHAEAADALQRLIAARCNAEVLSGVRGPHGLPPVGDSVLALDCLIEIYNEAVPYVAKGWVPLRMQLLPAVGQQ